MRTREPPLLNGIPSVAIEIPEWGYVGPDQDLRLRGLTLAGNISAQRLAEAVRACVDVREGYRGLEVNATSFVGHIDVGPLQISIHPKLEPEPLAQLLRYAYGLRDLKILGDLESPTIRHGLHDIVVALLATELEELLHRGLTRRYVPLSAALDSPRGRVDVRGIIRRGGVTEARLPCLYVERRSDWYLNQVLRTGLDLATQIAVDRNLRRHVQRLSYAFGDVARLANLSMEALDRAERELTRLTVAAASALTLIRLLLEAQGMAFNATSRSANLPGFLFDMNTFFQRLLSRFLHDHLASLRIADERAIRDLFAYAGDANPQRRSPPRPRPDYALLQGSALLGFLDAKYRDVWERGYPADWLYQLSIYALASPSQASVLLYASAATDARDERVEVRSPLSGLGRTAASVILRPVPLRRLAELLNSDRSRSSASERQQLAEKLVDLHVESAATR